MYSRKVTEASIIYIIVFVILTFCVAVFGIISWNDFITMLFIYVLIIVYLVISIFWNRYKEKKTTEKSIRLAKTDDRGFYLLLRSFDFRHLYETGGGWMDPEYRIPSGTTTVFDSLDRAIAEFGNLLILRPSKYKYEFDSTDYFWKAIIVDGGDGDYWKSAYRYLAEHCRAIILIPGTSRGSLHEIKYIRDSNFWKKTIVFMLPVHFRLGMWKYNASSNVESEVEFKKRAAWEQVSSELIKYNFHLPEYNRRGCVYLPNSDLSLQEGYFLPVGGFEDDRIKQGLTEIHKLKPFIGTPTNQVLTRFMEGDATLIWPNIDYP